MPCGSICPFTSKQSKDATTFKMFGSTHFVLVQHTLIHMREYIHFHACIKFTSRARCLFLLSVSVSLSLNCFGAYISLICMLLYNLNKQSMLLYNLNKQRMICMLLYNLNRSPARALSLSASSLTAEYTSKKGQSKHIHVT